MHVSSLWGDHSEGAFGEAALEWIESDMLPYYPIGVYKDRSAGEEK